MKKKILLFTVLSGLVALMSFTNTDFTKTLISKWELKTIQTPGKPAMDTKEILGDMFLEFKSDFTYVESGADGTSKKGTWKIIDGDYLQMKKDTQTNYTDKEKLKEIAPDQLEMTHPDKAKFVFVRVK